MLPVRYANPKIQSLLSSGGALPPVKYQVLTCQGHDIVVGRMKVETPTPSGHSFVLRRFDTGAVSLTTMFRAAFPTAPDDAEKSELQWVKDTFDLTGTNGSSRDTSITRLAGTWVHPTLAMELALEYAIAPLISLVVEAQPDPDTQYRKSAKSAANSSAAPPPPAIAPSRFGAVQASPVAPSPPSKRRKESSPGPSPAPLPAISASKTAPRRSTRSRTSPAPSPAATPRATRSRTKSPAVMEAPPTFGAAMSTLDSAEASSPSKRPTSRAKPPSSRAAAPSTPAKTSIKPASSTRKLANAVTKQESRLSVAGSDETAVEDERRHEDDEGHKVMTEAMEELHRADVQEQQQMVSDIMAAGGREMAVDAGPSSKRAREEDEDELPTTFDPKEPETEMRLIKTNPRVATYAPQRKAAAWGTGLFVFGVGALTLLPNLASQWL